MKHRIRLFQMLLSALIAVSTFSIIASAQGIRATVTGRVTDASGAVVPKARITITNIGTNETRTVETSDEGDYTVPQIPPGDYSLTVEQAGFKKTVRRFTLETGQEARLDVALQAGAVTEQVEITAVTPVVSSEDAALGNVVDQKKIVELPLNGRDYLQLAQLQPNVFAPAQNSTLGFRGGFNVAGNSEIANNYLLDGIDNNDETTNQPSHRPILDAVREFKVLTGTYGADYGRQAGGQIIVTTKSGSNDFHGSAFEFHRNSVFDARNFFARSCLKTDESGNCTNYKPSFRRNQFGGVFGGPIRKDRTFFFAGYEGQRRGQQEAGLASVPTLAMREGNFSSLLGAQQTFTIPAGTTNCAGAPGTVVPLTNRDGSSRLAGQILDPLTAQSTTRCNPVTGRVETLLEALPFAGNRIPQDRFINTVGAGLLALYPNPNVAGANNFVSSGTGRFGIDQWSARIDHKLRDNMNLFGSYQFADSTEFFPITNPLCSARDVPGFGCDELQRTQHFTLNWTWTISPRLINEARVGYSRFGFFRLQEDRDADVISELGIKGLTDAGRTPFNNGAPELIVPGFVTIGGPTNLPQGRHDNTYHYIESMTFINGAHTMKWGADIRRFLFNSFFTSFGRGSFRFDGRFTGHPVADMLLGAPFQADRNLGEPFHNAKTFSSGYYFQDDWKVTPKLTLNLGLRYEFNLPPIENIDKLASFDPATNTIKVAGGQEAFINPATNRLDLRPRPDVGRRLWETDKNNFAPRIGIAYRPFSDTKTVIRAGFGTFYNLQIVGNGITPLSRNSPFRDRQTSGPFAATVRPLPNVADAFSGNPSVVPPGIDENFKTAYINQWSLGVQRELAENLVLDVSYLGSTGHKLPLGVNINQAVPGPGSVASRRPFQGFGNITGGFIISAGNSNYHGLTARVERRFNNGLSFLSSYAWSKSIDDGSGISTASDSSGAAQNVRNLRAERALSDFDVTHRWVLSYVYDLPFGKGKRIAPSNKVADLLVSGWQMTGILTMQTGRPFTVLTGTDQSATGQNADRPNIIGDIRVSNPGPDRWFNPCTRLANGSLRNCQPGEAPVWAQNAAGTFGNAGRNILRGDGLHNFDLGVSRFFRVTERQQFQFRAEVFNLTNHPNFFLPVQSLASAAFGTITRAANTGAGAQRQIQFALKYIF
ncbi:MAG: carboxypeptidase regulatory-like domain-containing protein [Blastocatellia bacterium]